MRTCSSGLKNEPCAPFSDSAPTISKVMPRIRICCPIIASRLELSSVGPAAGGGDRVVVYGDVVGRGAHDVHVDVLVALLHLEVVAQLGHHRAHVARV